MQHRFYDRIDAGKRLAELLAPHYKGKRDTVVIGLPRGGVPVAYEVATELDLPLDVVVPRKIGAPFNPEFAVGAITEDGEVDLNMHTLNYLHLSPSELEDTIQKERKESQRRVKAFRGDRPPLEEAAIKSLRKRNAKSVTVAVPVASPRIIPEFKKLADEVYCISTPIQFNAVGQFYDDFSQTNDSTVVEIMKKCYSPKKHNAV